VNAAGVRRLAGITQILLVVPVGGKIGLGVETANGTFEIVLKRGVPFSSRLCRSGANGFSGPFQSGGEGLLDPVFLGWGRMAALKDLGNRAFGCGRPVQVRLLLGIRVPG